jgi:hypothetical protein
MAVDRSDRMADGVKETYSGFGPLTVSGRLHLEIFPDAWGIGETAG